MAVDLTGRCVHKDTNLPENIVQIRLLMNFPLFDLSPEKDLQHRLEVLALATDGEESCPMEGRPFQRL